jgi:ABC-type glutathione transport system ATPase component
MIAWQTASLESAAPVVEVSDAVVTYRRAGGRNARLKALNEVSIAVSRAETLGVVGESGSGKTTLGRLLVGLVEAESGRVLFGGRSINDRRVRRALRGRLQVVLQNPDWSLNPAIRVWRSVAEPLVIAGVGSRHRRRELVNELLSRVGLGETIGQRRPHELSGGQRQRVAIARALITEPDLIVFDEAVTALDASVQTQVLNLIRDLQAERGFAALFISHDLAAVRYVSDRVAVMRSGEIVETGDVRRFYDLPDHPYSRELVSSLRRRNDARPEDPFGGHGTTGAADTG